MGRRKIQIAPIVDDRNRNVTFGKRRNGLFKKAFELGVLCQVDVAVLVWSHTGKLHCYSSQGVMHKMIDRYQNQAVDETDISGPNAYGHIEGGTAAANGSEPAANTVKLSTTKSGNKKRRRSSDDSDDDDDDDGEDDAEEAPLPVKAEKRSNSKNNSNGNQTNGADDAMRQDSQDAFANGNMGNQQMPPGNPYGAPYFGGYPNIPGYQQYNAQQQALQNSFGLYGNMSAEAAQRAAAYQAAAAYGFGPSFLMNNNNGNQGKYPAAYTPIQSPPPMPDSAPTHLQGPTYGGGRDRLPQRQESMNSEHGSTTSRPELHLSVPGLAPNESALRLDGRGDGQNGRGEPDDGRRSIFHASDSLLHLSENFGPSPSSLFPEIYRSMNHFGDSAAFQAAMAMNSAEEAAAGVFKWPTINNNNSNSSFSNNNTPPAATTKIEETSMRSTQGNEGTATPQNNEENRRSPSHPQGDST